MIFLMVLRLALALPLIQSAPQTERILAVSSGERLEVNPVNKGQVIIRGWDREELRLQAFHAPEIEIGLQRSQGLVKIEERRPTRSALEDVRIEIMLPRSFQVWVVGHVPEVIVEGLRGPVQVNTNQGDVTIRNVSGNIRLNSSGGRLQLAKVKGIVQLKTTHDSIAVDGLEGDIEAETVSGDISLIELDSKRVKATSHSGSIAFQGPAAEGGLYDFASDKGDVELRLSQPLNASFTVGTVSGDFQCSFPVGEGVPKKGQRFTFQVGSGAAQFELLTFSGAIRVLQR